MYKDMCDRHTAGYISTAYKHGSYTGRRNPVGAISAVCVHTRYWERVLRMISHFLRHSVPALRSLTTLHIMFLSSGSHTCL